MSLALVKKGDSVMVTALTGAVHRREVTSAGPAWITVGRTRYRRSDGRSERGVGATGIESLDAFDLRQRRSIATKCLSLLGIELNRYDLSVEKIEAMVSAVQVIVDEETKR